MKTVAARLKYARDQKNWTQTQLALVAGVSPGTIGNIESGARQSKGSIPQIAEALGVNHKWLFAGQGEMLLIGSATTMPAPTALSGMALVARLTAALQSNSLNASQVQLLASMLDEFSKTNTVETIGTQRV